MLRVCSHEGDPIAQDRQYWTALADKIARPVLTNCAAGTLKARMPVETVKGRRDERKGYTYLEALGRTLSGLAPWLELPADDTPEGKLRSDLADHARRSIAQATDPQSPDHMNFSRGGQPLVDAAFLAHALIRAPGQLWEKLDDPAKKNLTAALTSTRAIKPGQNNWLLFSAMVEAALCHAGADWKQDPIDTALNKHMDWYKGDGAYGDGQWFHWDYYNSFVIHPMLVDVLQTVSRHTNRWNHLRERVLTRSRRYAEVQERLVAPDGTFPPMGRSLAYRCGAFQLLAQVALRKELPNKVTPAQVRCALTAVIRKTMDAPGTFTPEGWLTIGLAGHQPGLGEPYISTGSLYLCTTALLPLGLPPTDEFWTDAPTDWTARRIWSGQDAAADHAIRDQP